MYLKTSRGYVYVCHPENFSKTPVKLGQELWTSHIAPDGSKPHVVLGHTHHMQKGYSPDAMQEIVSLGCMRDPKKTKYKQRSANKHYEWNRGFLMIKNGHFYPFNMDVNFGIEYTDWKFWLGDFADLLDVDVRHENPHRICLIPDSCNHLSRRDSQFSISAKRV